MEAYFDESGTHHGSRAMVVAGHLFSPEGAAGITRDFDSALKQFGVPYFRMSQCANGAGPFKSLSTDDRIALEKKLIVSIHLRMEAGFALAIAVNEYYRLTDERFRNARGDAYSFCCQWCLHQVGLWADKNSVDDSVKYFFESGHATAERTNAYFNKIRLNEEATKKYRYKSHTFADKKTLLPLQVADILAWHWHSVAKRKLENIHAKARRDTNALLTRPGYYLEYFNAHRTMDVFINSAPNDPLIEIKYNDEEP
jgi:hypothetical protein